HDLICRSPAGREPPCNHLVARRSCARGPPRRLNNFVQVELVRPVEAVAPRLSRAVLRLAAPVARILAERAVSPKKISGAGDGKAVADAVAVNGFVTPSR